MDQHNEYTYQPSSMLDTLITYVMTSVSLILLKTHWQETTMIQPLIIHLGWVGEAFGGLIQVCAMLVPVLATVKLSRELWISFWGTDKKKVKPKKE